MVDAEAANGDFAPAAADLEAKDAAGEVSFYDIGGVRFPVASRRPSALVPRLPAVRGVPAAQASGAELEVLRWMMQKASMRQDMFLLGPPGPLLRHLVFRFCSLFNREVEYVGITRDTNEADLKQRREIRAGRVEYTDQPPVQAALKGRVLVLEGIEKAERNVLPLLNNLLENREMALEDRRFLLSSERAAQLRAEHGSEIWNDTIVPVHPDFIVIALGLPGRGNPLDPPLRSRFAALSIPQTMPSDVLSMLSEVWPSTPHPALTGVCNAAAMLQEIAAGERDVGEDVALPAFPEGGVNGIFCLLEKFPRLDPADAMLRVYPVRSFQLSNAELDVAGKAFTKARRGAKGVNYNLVQVERAGDRLATLKFHGKDTAIEVQAPAGHWLASDKLADGASRSSSDAAENEDDEAMLKKMSVKELKAWLTARGLKHADLFEKSEMIKRAKEHLESQPAGPPRPKGVLAQPVVGITLSPTQATAVSAMLTDHAAGIDVCLIGEKGVGKSALVRAFAGLLGYRCRVIFCYKDMISRDLLQRRTTDPNGNTQWMDSPLVEAALSGDLAVLDGVHRLATGTLYSTIGPMLSDREAVLPDGSRLVSPSRWPELVAARGLPEGCSVFEEAGTRFRPMHPAFRCIAAGEPPTGKRSESWLDEEVSTLFHFHVVPPLPNEEQLVLTSRTGADPKIFAGLFSYSEKMRKAAADDLNLEPLRLSVRVLLRIALHLQSRPSDLEGAVNRAFSACLRFLPPPSQEAVDRMLVSAMREAGVTMRGLRHTQATAASEAETKKRREELRELENVAIQARMYSSLGGQVDQAREHAEQDRAKQKENRLASLRKKASTAAARAVVEGANVINGTLRIKDVSAPVRSPTRPELVPDVSFVDIPGHVEALRDMLLDWSLGHHLLLVGNQGVGKNKLADRLLCLLRCEREYVQLHRDTTVQSLTLAPTLEDGVVVWEDSPLVRAVKAGRCLVVDEADKAPLEVVCVLKALCDDGELALLDGRTIVRADDPRLIAVAGTPAEAEFVPTAPGFRMIVLANRPGYPFLGNDFYRVCGDVFSCHAIDNPDIESEVALLRSVGPDVPKDKIVQLSVLFAELRDLVDAGQLAYPYSMRELVKLVAHAQQFPGDSLEQAAAGVFAFDLVDRQRRAPLLEVLKRHGVAVGVSGEDVIMGRSHGDLTLKLDDENKGKNPDKVGKNDKPPPMKEHGPKHGEWDGKQHIGGNRFAGGAGGTGTAGLGGRWGPYRLDSGQDIVMVSQEHQEWADQQAKKKAQQMADEAYTERLKEIKMTLKEGEEYIALRTAVGTQIQEMKVCLAGHEARELERQWLKNQTHGELDDSRLVDGITGSKTIYTRRGEPDSQVFGISQKEPKRITFVMDISGSMYTFNRIDRRMQRLQELAVFIFESFTGFEDKYDYRMVGHSGTGPEAERLVEWGRPPRSEKERLQIVKKMEAHAQFCASGDNTLEGTSRAINELSRKPADERFLFVVSDADLQRYGIDTRNWRRILEKDPSVKAYVIMISNNADEAERIKATLPPGHGHICAETASLAVTFKQIFKDSMLRDP